MNVLFLGNPNIDSYDIAATEHKETGTENIFDTQNFLFNKNSPIFSS